jgi:hypothetical protein
MVVDPWPFHQPQHPYKHGRVGFRKSLRDADFAGANSGNSLFLLIFYTMFPEVIDYQHVAVLKMV